MRSKPRGARAAPPLAQRSSGSSATPIWSGRSIAAEDVDIGAVVGAAATAPWPPGAPLGLYRQEKTTPHARNGPRPAVQRNAGRLPRRELPLWPFSTHRHRAQENRKSSRRFFFFSRRKWAGGRRVLQGGGAAFRPASACGAQVPPAAHSLPLRAAHLGFCSAVANGGVAKGFDAWFAWQSASECLCLMAVLSAAGPGRISCDGWTERKRA